MILSGSIGKLLWPGLNAIYGMSHAEIEEKHPQIFTMKTSDKNFEETQSLYGMGLATVRAENAKGQYDTMAAGFTNRYVHVEYFKGFSISRIALEDNQYAELGAARTKALAMSMSQTKENVAANVLNRAFTSGYAGADGLELCSTVHISARDGATYANELATPLDVSELALESMCINIMDMTNDAGLRVGLQSRKLVIPTAIKYEVKRILGSDMQSHTANNALNALKADGSFPEGVVVNQYLTDSDAFFILTNCPNGLTGFDRRKLDFAQDTDFDSDAVKFRATARYSFGWDDPRCIYGSAGAA